MRRTRPILVLCVDTKELPGLQSRRPRHLPREGDTPTYLPFEARTRLRRSALVVVIALLGASGATYAAKWRHCPDQLGYYPSSIGAVSSPFVHPGHELGIFLNSQEIGASGGFSMGRDGNIVRITF